MTDKATASGVNPDAPEAPVEGSDPKGDGGSQGAESVLRRLEGQVARLEAQVRAQGDRLAELDQGARAKKQQGLYLRLVLLALALGAFFLLKARAGA